MVTTLLTSRCLTWWASAASLLAVWPKHCLIPSPTVLTWTSCVNSLGSLMSSAHQLSATRPPWTTVIPCQTVNRQQMQLSCIPIEVPKLQTELWYILFHDVHPCLCQSAPQGHWRCCASLRIATAIMPKLPMRSSPSLCTPRVGLHNNSWSPMIPARNSSSSHLLSNIHPLALSVWSNLVIPKSCSHLRWTH